MIVGPDTVRFRIQLLLLESRLDLHTHTHI